MILSPVILWRVILWPWSHVRDFMARDFMGCHAYRRVTPGRSWHSPRPYTWALYSQVNRKRTRTSDEECMKGPTIRVYINRLWCEAEQTKELVGRPASTQSKGERLTKKAVIFHSIYYVLRAHNVTALILSYKRSHGDRHRRLVIMKTGGTWTIEATSMVKIQSSKSVNQSYAPAAYGDRFWFTIVCYISI